MTNTNSLDIDFELFNNSFGHDMTASSYGASFDSTAFDFGTDYSSSPFNYLPGATEEPDGLQKLEQSVFAASEPIENFYQGDFIDPKELQLQTAMVQNGDSPLSIWQSPSASQYAGGFQGNAEEEASLFASTIEYHSAEPSKKDLAAENARLMAMVEAMNARLGEPQNAIALITPPRNAQAIRPQTTPRKRTTARVANFDPSSSKQLRPMTPIPVSIPQGPIEAMWSPGVTPEQRRAIHQQLTSTNEQDFIASSSEGVDFGGYLREALPTPVTPSQNTTLYSLQDGQVVHNGNVYAPVPNLVETSSLNNVLQRHSSPQISAENGTLSSEMYSPASTGAMSFPTITASRQAYISSPAAITDVKYTNPTCKPAAKRARTSATKNTRAPKKIPAPKKTPSSKKTTKLTQPKPQQAQYQHPRALSAPNLPVFDAAEAFSLTSQLPHPHERPVSVLYKENFMTLALEEKARILLPLLQGIDPNTGEKWAEPGSLAFEVPTHAEHTTSSGDAHFEPSISYMQTPSPVIPAEQATSPAEIDLDAFLTSLHECSPQTPAIEQASPFYEHGGDVISSAEAKTRITNSPDEQGSPLSTTDINTLVSYVNGPSAEIQHDTTVSSDLINLSAQTQNEILDFDHTSINYHTGFTPTDSSVKADDYSDPTSTDVVSAIKMAQTAAAKIENPESGAMRQREALMQHERRAVQSRRR